MFNLANILLTQKSLTIKNFTLSVRAALRIVFKTGLGIRLKNNPYTEYEYKKIAIADTADTF